MILALLPPLRLIDAIEVYYRHTSNCSSRDYSLSRLSKSFETGTLIENRISHVVSVWCLSLVTGDAILLTRVHHEYFHLAQASDQDQSPKSQLSRRSSLILLWASGTLFLSLTISPKERLPATGSSSSSAVPEFLRRGRHYIFVTSVIPH